MDSSSRKMYEWLWNEEYMIRHKRNTLSLQWDSTTPVRMAKIEKTDLTGAVKQLDLWHRLMEMQSWTVTLENVCRLLISLNMCLPDDLAAPLLWRQCPHKICTWMFLVVLFTVTKTRKQPNWPLGVDKGVVGWPHDGLGYSSTKRSELPINATEALY